MDVKNGVDDIDGVGDMYEGQKEQNRQRKKQ